MDTSRNKVQNQISVLFDSQEFAVLSTAQSSQPYASLVAFAASRDLKYFYFLTPDTTRKYENLRSNPKVAVLVNNSRNTAEDIYNAVSVTGTGIASVVEKAHDKKALAMFLDKHPHMKDFSRAPTTALICITMNRYFMVNRFQNVIEYRVNL
ncbi:MAG: pyridoxamine 5'-phosphate oxidase family protein [Desulfobacteraceae bacterium]